MSQQNACGGPTCGCSSMCLHPEPPAGSSVPEAARAAAQAAWNATKAEPGGWDANVIRFIDAALAAAAPFIVAAAVAEERATTEWQPGRWWTVLDKDGGIWCQTSDEKEARRSMRDPERAPYTLHRQWVTVQRSELRPVRAALASPGEGE